MITMILESIGFLLYFAYDINSISKKYKILQKGFLIGTIFVAIASIRMLIDGWKMIDWRTWITYLGFLSGIFMFGLLIYTLFFALPFESTYVEESKERMAYTEGMYAICRHPGVLWYAGMYLCMMGILKTKEAFVQGIVFILWNIAYILLQDIFTFPKTFTNYAEYKKTTPFLIPNKKSIIRCVKTRKKGGAAQNESQ